MQCAKQSKAYASGMWWVTKYDPFPVIFSREDPWIEISIFCTKLYIIYLSIYDIYLYRESKKSETFGLVFSFYATSQKKTRLIASTIFNNRHHTIFCSSFVLIEGLFIQVFSKFHNFGTPFLYNYVCVYSIQCVLKFHLEMNTVQ